MTDQLRANELRERATQQLMIATNAINAAFEHQNPVMLDAALEECMRLIDVIRLARKERA